MDRRRSIEDRALELGAERVDLQRRLQDNRLAITVLLQRAVGLGIAVEQFARLVGVRRASLYRWREVTKETSK